MRSVLLENSEEKKQKSSNKTKVTRSKKPTIKNQEEIKFMHAELRLGPCLMFLTAMKITPFVKPSLQTCQQSQKMTSKTESLATGKELFLSYYLMSKIMNQI